MICLRLYVSISRVLEAMFFKAKVFKHGFFGRKEKSSLAYKGDFVLFKDICQTNTVYFYGFHCNGFAPAHIIEHEF